MGARRAARRPITGVGKAISLLSKVLWPACWSLSRARHPRRNHSRVRVTRRSASAVGAAILSNEAIGG